MSRRGYRIAKPLPLLLLCCVFVTQVLVQPATCQDQPDQAPAHNSSRASRSHRHRGAGQGPSQKPSHHGEQQALAKSSSNDTEPQEQHHEPQQPLQDQQHQPPQQQQQQQQSAGWEGGAFWLEEKPRTLYFEPIAGLGNRLRALASAVIVARTFGVGIKMVWKSEPPCPACSIHYAAFVSTWDDLFVKPKIPRADNFPGTNVSMWDEKWLERFPDGHGPGGKPPDNCTIHVVNSYEGLAEVLTSGWETVLGQEVVCAKGTSWLTRRGEYDAAPFFGYLRPAPVVQEMIDRFKASVQWDTTQWICTHVRRTDLTIRGNGTRFAADVIQLGGYTRVIKALLELATIDQDTRVFLATDDAAAEKEIQEVFEEGRVVSYPKAGEAWTRSSTEGIQAALADILLLSSCPVLVGTFYSSYSETAKLMGKGFYVQVGGELGKQQAVTMHQFERVRNSTFHDRDA